MKKLFCCIVFVCCFKICFAVTDTTEKKYQNIEMQKLTGAVNIGGGYKGFLAGLGFLLKHGKNWGVGYSALTNFHHTSLPGDYVGPVAYWVHTKQTILM